VLNEKVHVLLFINYWALFMIFNLWIGPHFIYESRSQFLIFNSYFPVITLCLDVFIGAHFNKLLFLWYPMTKHSLKMERQPASKIRWWTKSQKRRLCQLTLVELCSLFCSYMMIWQHMPWFGSAGSSSEQSSLALPTQI